MTSLREQYDSLQDTLLSALGSAVSNITTDGAFVSPQAGAPTLLIEPPELDSDDWQSVNAVWKVDVIAAGATTQALSFFDCLDVIDLMVAKNINIASATPITWRGTGGSLVGYQITLNPLDD